MAVPSVISPNSIAFPARYVKVVADTPTLSVAEYLLRYSRRLRRTSVLCIGGRMWVTSVITILLTHCYLLISISTTTTSLIFPWWKCELPRQWRNNNTSIRNKVLLRRHWIVNLFQQITASICGGIYARVCCILYCVYDVVVRKTSLPNRSAITLSLIWWLFNTVVLPRRKESARSLSHLLMSFLFKPAIGLTNWLFLPE